jgi:protein gp37
MNHHSLILYDAACRALAEAHRVDEVKSIRDKAVAMQAYAKQAKNTTLITQATELRMRAERRAGELLRDMREHKERHDGRNVKGKTVQGSPLVTPEKAPKLADFGVTKSQSSRWQKLAALDDKTFEAEVATKSERAYDDLARSLIEGVKIEPKPPRGTKVAEASDITLARWKGMTADEKRESLKPENFPSDVKFNKQDSEGIDWAQFSWNPIVGCKHPCRIYCWAHDVTLRFPARYPHGFDPVWRPRMLNAPYNTPVPAEAAVDGRFKNVFTVSMGDLFGGWIPREWIETVLTAVRDNSQWNFLFLTKFPKRIAEFEIPANAWMGTTIDVQARVANAEAAFADLRVKNPDAIFWLSVEPMLEPIRFNRLDLFSWLVMGGAARSMRTPEFRPPERWIVSLVAAADAANVKIFQKTNLHGNRILELPLAVPIKTGPQVAPAVFDYLKGAAR